MLNLNKSNATSREISATSIIITDYSRTIYCENSLIDGRKRERGREEIRVGRRGGNCEERGRMEKRERR